MAAEVKTRKRKPQDEYTQARNKHRKATDRHVLVLEAYMNEDDKRHIFNLANRIRLASNELTGAMQKRLDQLLRTRIYRETLAKYDALRKALSEVKDKESAKFKELDAQRKAVGKELQALQEQCGVTFAAVTKLAEAKGKQFGFPAVFGLTCAIDVWSGVESVLYGNGKRLNFKKRGDLPEIRATQPNRAIVIKSKNGELTFSMDGVAPFGVIIKEGDVFAETEVRKLVEFLSNKDAERYYVNKFLETGEVQDTFRTCYCSLVCKEIRGKLRVFVHITIEGRPVQKVRADGTPRHSFGKGVVGTDIGTQSIAGASMKGLILDNMAERHSVCTKNSERAEKILRRKMDRSRRAMNPERFNEDGTYKKGSQGKWKKSKNYRRNERQLKEICRKNAESREYSTNEMANKMRALGDILVTEPSNAKSLQKKAKLTKKVDPATGKTKYNRRKRFGKSILYRCPGLMFATLKKKFEMTGGQFYTVDRMYRASQYDHKSNTYTKKKLSQRWHVFEDGTKVQRDLYSAFLMLCANEDFTSPDRAECDALFASFYSMHTNLVTDIIKRGKPICNSGIKIAA